MLRNIAVFFHKKRKTIEEELVNKDKIDKVITDFIDKEILKGVSIEYGLSYTTNKGIIKIETGNKIIAQEIALRIRGLEERLRNKGVAFKKLLI